MPAVFSVPLLTGEGSEHLFGWTVHSCTLPCGLYEVLLASSADVVSFVELCQVPVMVPDSEIPLRGMPDTGDV